jgi:YidC/Oxa1 family membrane protein insertase
MDKNTIIAIGLSTVVIIAGFTIQATFFPSEPVKTQQNSAVAEKKPELVSGSIVDTTEQQLVLDTSKTPVDQNTVTEENSFIETKLAKIEFTNRGGDIVSYKIKGAPGKNNDIEMAEFVNDKDRAFSLTFGDANGIPVNDLFKVKKLSDTSIGFYRTFTVKNQDGTEGTFTLVKQYTFLPDDYMFELKVVIDGDSSFTGLQTGKFGYTIKTSPQIGPQWNVQQDKYEYRRFYYLSNGKKKIVNLNQGQTKEITEPISWAGVAGKYFTLIALPEKPVQKIEFNSVSSSTDTTESQILLSRAPITSRTSTDIWRFYLGPRTEKNLSVFNVSTSNPYKLSDTKIDLIVESSGVLAPIEIGLKWIMELSYRLIPNWGVSIIILTILMRLVLFPLTKKSTESTIKMQELQPKIQEIQTKYKENSQKMNEEMAKFYKTAGYNPLSGCLPLLIQFPLIFAMYNLFNNYFEFRGAMFIPGWIPDLSQGDSVLKFAFTVPFLGWSDLRILPIIYVISQLLFGKVTQTPTTSQQNSSMKLMMYGMPLFFFFIFYNAPSGLLIYWTFSNILTLLQQVLINGMMRKKGSSNLKLVKN